MPAGGVLYPIYRDAWLARVGTANYGNGSGPRLQIGGAVINGVQWQSRSALSFVISEADFPAGLSSSGITRAVLRMKVRGTQSCMAKGSAPKFWLERTLAVGALVTENVETLECTVTAGDHDWGHTLAGQVLETTTADRIKWEGSPSAGDIIEIDVTTLFRAWWAVRAGALNYTMVLKAADTASGYDETNGARRIAFHSAETTGPSELQVDWQTSSPPAAPSVNLTPTGRQIQPGSRVFTGDFTHPDATLQAAGPLSELIEVSRNADMSAPVHAATYTNPVYDAGTRRWSTTRVYTELRDGAPYYWRCKVTDQNGEQSAYSAVKSYTMNRLPVVDTQTP